MILQGRGALSVIAAAALAIAGCGGGDADTQDTQDTVAADGTVTAGADLTPSVGNRPTADDPIVVRANELAGLLIGQLGDDSTAAGAVLLAGDEGYSAPQIEAAIAGADLAADGSIVGLEPTVAPFGLVIGFRTASPPTIVEPLPIERFRDEAAREAGREDYWPSGGLATGLILQWQLAGYSQQQIVEMLIFGVDFLDGEYDGDIAMGEEECGGYVIGGTHEIPDFCDPETGELHGEREQPPAGETIADPTEAGAVVGLCGGDFAPPYDRIPIEGAGAMLETEILGPLSTPYYYSEVSGFLDIQPDGELMLVAHTTRLADIMIRGAPDNQIYLRDFVLTGSIDAEGDAVLTGTVDGTDQLWADDAQNPVSADSSGQLAVVCDDAEDSGFAILGFATGNGLLEFEARP